MRRLILAALIAAAAAFPVIGSARMAVAPCNAHLSARSELTCGRANLKHAEDVLRFLSVHHEYGTTVSRRLVHRDHAWLRRFALARIAEARARLLPAWPPHHALWLCIHSGEGGWREPSRAKGWVGGVFTSLYWGGMQMHADWGYGTSHHASDDTQSVQEWAAETAYRESGYSRTWLYGQWAADARCF